MFWVVSNSGTRGGGGGLNDIAGNENWWRKGEEGSYQSSPGDKSGGVSN